MKRVILMVGLAALLVPQARASWWDWTGSRVQGGSDVSGTLGFDETQPASFDNGVSRRYIAVADASVNVDGVVWSIAPGAGNGETAISDTQVVAEDVPVVNGTHFGNLSLEFYNPPANGDKSLAKTETLDQPQFTVKRWGLEIIDAASGASEKAFGIIKTIGKKYADAYGPAFGFQHSPSSPGSLGNVGGIPLGSSGNTCS